MKLKMAFVMDPIQTKVEEIVLKILSHLRSVQEDITGVSSIALKRTLGLTDIPSTTFTRAIRQVAEVDPTWVLDGRSLRRSSHRLVPSSP